LGLESLEDRVALSTLGPEFLVNATGSNSRSQFASDNASSMNGMSVAVWVDTYSANDHDIRAQLFDAYQRKLGPEIIVDYSTIDSGEPKVAMDSHGNFVVAWTNFLPGGKSDVEARIYNSAGAPVTGTLPVAASARPEHAPDVAMDANGNFVVSYTYDYSSTDQDVYANRYSSTGQFLQEIPVAVSSHNESRSSVAMSGDGRFAIAYQYQYSSTDDDIYLVRYSATGSPLGSQAVASTGAYEQAPSVAMDEAGNAVVAYQVWVGNNPHIMARRVSSAGLVGGAINVSGNAGDQRNPSVALSRAGNFGAFVVAYDSLGQVDIAEVSAWDTVTRWTNIGGEYHEAPAISINGVGDYFVTYTQWVTDVGPRHIFGRFGHLYA
jgi:hypothetical protein